MVKKNKTVTPSPEAVRKARLAAALNRLAADEEYLHIDTLRRTHIVFFYAGYYIRFERCFGRVVRCGGDHRYLGTEDYAVMFNLAKMIFTARDKGDQEAIKEKAALSAERKKQAPPEPPIMFDECDLPIRRKPK